MKYESLGVYSAATGNPCYRGNQMDSRYQFVIPKVAILSLALLLFVWHGSLRTILIFLVFLEEC
jgi:hypothetical protein